MIEIAMSKYARKGNASFPKKYTVDIYRRGEQKKQNVRIEMFVARISFNSKVNENAFIPNWPHDAVKIDTIPEDPKELFGEIEIEEEGKQTTNKHE